MPGLNGCDPDTGSTVTDAESVRQTMTLDVGVDGSFDATPLTDGAERPSPMALTERRLSLPIHPDDREHIHAGLVIGVDHGPRSDSPTECTNYSGRPFPGCYNGHEGTDFMVWGGFETIDRMDIRVVAAAAGVVTFVEDGHYDRCHGDISTFDVDCDGHEMRANRVHLEHADGRSSRYLHLKKNSAQVVVGMRVECGSILGLVGSSGRSVAPHLHFELYDERGVLTDPYAGERSQAMSYWIDQSGSDGLPVGGCPGHAMRAQN